MGAIAREPASTIANVETPGTSDITYTLTQYT
jgi:hypothetical protein